jgi:S-DNA-T family DNA segregation ATPase FtsK/SpoIIIE
VAEKTKGMSKAKKNGGKKASKAKKSTSAKAKRAATAKVESAEIPRGWGEFLGVSLLAIGALMFGGLFSFQFGNGTFMGPVGQIVAGALYAGFGMAGYLIALGVVGIGFKALSGRRMEIRLGEGVGFSFATIAGCVLLHVSFPEYRVHRYTAGGLTGELLGEVSLGLFDYAGTYLICVTTLCLGLIASTPLETDHIFGVGRHASEWIKSGATYLWEGIVSVADSGREAFADESEEWAEEDEYDEEEEYEEEDEYEHEDEEEDELVEAAPKRKRKAKAKPAKANTKKANTKKSKVVEAKAKKSKANSKKASSAPANDLDELGADSEDNIESAGKTIVLDTPSAKPNKSKAPKAPAPAQAEAEPAAEPPAEEGPEIVLPAAEAVGPGKKKAPPRAGELAKRKVKMPKPEPKEKKPAGAGRVEYLKGSYELPPLELFAPPKQEKIEVDKEFVKQQADAIVETLAQFRIKGKVTKIHPGPVITRYEFKPEAGIKVSKIQSLENDLAMALEAIRIRILAPIPGKSTVGLEVPNKTRENVYLQENLADESFGEGGKMILPMVLGNDIVGRAVSIDLAKSPHLLVAGATGSGKSVGVNAMISSLLYSRTPEDLRMILIDPKMLEFGVYQDVPHLLLPVITDAEKANLALRWTVNEMERRYEALSRVKVRNVEGYNDKLPLLQAEWDAEQKMLEAEAAKAALAIREDGDEDAVGGMNLGGVTIGSDGQTTMSFGGSEGEPRPEKMPFIVVIIDEFADLMMVASKEVEANVARIAAKARAAGIHLIVATQRPSVDVITGTIKNNFPSRIAFQVTSDMDSRTILDRKGAKQLLGMGDMLYMDRGKEPRRVHGAYVSESEIEKVVDFVKQQARPAYDLSITTRADASDDDDGEDKFVDPLYDKALSIVAEKGKVSTSMIQRHLSVGYNRAAKLVDAMETEGVIGPPNGSKPREVYISAA